MDRDLDEELDRLLRDLSLTTNNIGREPSVIVDELPVEYGRIGRGTEPPPLPREQLGSDAMPSRDRSRY